MAKRVFQGLDDNTGIARRTAEAVGRGGRQSRPVPALNVPDGLELDGQAAVYARAIDHVKNGLPVEAHDDPYFGELLAAAFRTENTIGSLISAAREGGDDPTSAALSPEDVFERARSDGLDAHMDAFRGVETAAQYDARKDRVEREIRDRRLLQAGGWSGMGAAMIAGLVDAPTLLPAGALVRTGGGALKTAAGVSAASALDATVSEIALQSSQLERTFDEGAANVAASAIFGGVLGFGVGAVVGRRTERAVEDRLDAVRASAAGGFAGERSVGARQLDAFDTLASRGYDGKARGVFSAGAFELLDALDRIPGPIGAKVRNARRSMEKGLVPAERAFADRIAHNPRVTEANAAGIPNPETTIANEYAAFNGRFVDLIHETDKAWKELRGNYRDRDQFNRDVTLAIIRDEPHPDPKIEKLARRFRDDGIRPIFDRHVENGTFADDMTPDNADHYFPVVYDAEAIMNRKSEFVELERVSWLDHLNKEYDAAVQRRAAYKAVRAEARQRQADKIKQVRAETKAEGKANRAAIGKSYEDDKAAVEAAFDKSAKAARDKVRGEFDKQIAEAQAKFDAEFAERNEALSDMLSGDITPKRARELRAQLKKFKDRHENRMARLNKDAEAATLRALRPLEKQRAIDLERARVAYETRLSESSAAVKAARDAVKAERVEMPELPGDGILKFSSPAAREAEAQRIADEWYKSVTGQRRFTLDHEIGAGLPNYRKRRSNPVRHEMLVERGFVKYDPIDLMEFYTRKAGTDAAIGTIYKRMVPDIDEGTGLPKRGEDGKPVMRSVGDHTLSSVEKDIKDQYQALLDIERADGKAGADGEAYLRRSRDRAVDGLHILRSMMRGEEYGPGSSAGWRDMAEVLGSLNFLRLMGGTVISSLGDPINLVIANGFKRSVQHGIRPMLRDFKSAWLNADGEARRLTRLLVQNVEREVNKTVLDAADLGNPLARDGKAVNMMRDLSNRFSRLTGITQWNSFWRQVSARVVQGRLLEDALAGWGKLSKSERAWLANNGVDESGLAAIAKQYEAQTEHFLPDGGAWPRFDTWDDPRAVRLFRNVAFNESANNVIAPQFVDKMAMSATPGGRLFGQFRQHMLANQVRLIGRNIQFASLDKEKAATVYAGLFGLVMAGALVDSLKMMMGESTVTGASKTRSEQSAMDRVIEAWAKNPGGQLFNSLDRSGIFGVAMEGNNMIEKVLGIGGKAAFGVVAGDESMEAASRFKNRGVLDSVAGPTVGLLEDAAGALSSLNDGNISRADFKRLRRLAWGQNAPVLQQIMNSGEAAVGTIYDWPEPR